MTKTKLNKFRKQLQDYSARARGTAQGLEADARAPVSGDEAGSLSNVPMHLADAGSTMYTQELSATLLEHEEHVMSEIAGAIERIEQGTFGVCENCGVRIAEGRLEVVPYTRYCIQCAEQLGGERPANLNAGRQEVPTGLRQRPPRTTSGTDDSGLLDGDRLPVTDLYPPPGKPDVHAVGTAGGGTAVGGLAGTTIGTGAPGDAGLEEAMGSSEFDAEEVDAQDNQAYASESGEAVGGTPANKRAVGGRHVRGGIAPQSGPGKPTGQ